MYSKYIILKKQEYKNQKRLPLSDCPPIKKLRGQSCLIGEIGIYSKYIAPSIAPPIKKLRGAILFNWRNWDLLQIHCPLRTANYIRKKKSFFKILIFIF